MAHMDQEDKRRIVLIKELLHQASLGKSDGSVVGITKLAVLAGLAVELVLLAAHSATVTTQEGNDDLRYWTMWNRLRHHFADLGTLERKVKTVRDLRNNAIHGHWVPHHDDALQACESAEEIIRAVAREVWDLSLEEVHYLELVRQERARSLLERAQAAFKDDADYAEAIRCASEAFEEIWHDFYSKQNFPVACDIPQGATLVKMLKVVYNAIRDSAESIAERLAEGPAKSAFRQFAIDMHYAKADLSWIGSQRAFAPFELARYGVAPERTNRFLAIAPELEFQHVVEEQTMSNKVIFLEAADWSPTRDDALFAIDYVCELGGMLSRWMESYELPEVGKSWTGLFPKLDEEDDDSASERYR